MSMKKNRKTPPSVIAYLSMEIALPNGLKNYAGGLGVLAGDILQSAASARFPLVGVTLLNRAGYFRQRLVKGQQQSPAEKMDLRILKKLPFTVPVMIGRQAVMVAVWRHELRGPAGFRLPVYYLDTDLPQNPARYRQLTGRLYGGDHTYRLQQEIILGRAGIKALRFLGYKLEKVHLNEGHGALAAVELYQEQEGASAARRQAVKKVCVFTTHTPLPEAQDVYPRRLLLEQQPDFPELEAPLNGPMVNFTHLALYFSGRTNAVSRLHAQTSRRLFPGYKIRAITNGVNSQQWTSPFFQKLFDRFTPGWRSDAERLRGAARIPLEEIREAQRRAKRSMIAYLKKRQGINLKEEVFTIVFARRFTSYKRPDYILRDFARLLEVARQAGPMQLIFSGKSHPRDLEGQRLIKRVFDLSREKIDDIKVCFLENYDLEAAGQLVAGADLWLNNPTPPIEASGTSGMKAAHNGVPQLSTPDGWWPEGYRKKKTGWMIKERRRGGSNIYDLLQKEILPLYYRDSAAWARYGRFAISANASYFNSDRLVRQYRRELYK